MLSVFPEKTWKLVEPEIAWLYKPGSGVPLPDWLGKVTGIGAQSIDCGIGKISLRIIELNPATRTVRALPSTEVIAKFPHDNGAYTQILLGLGGNAQRSWKIVIDTANARAWLDY